MEKVLEERCANFRRYRRACLSLIIALSFLGEVFGQSTGQPPRQVTFTINGQVGTNQTIEWDSTANAWAIVSEGNKHILKVPGIRLVTATGTANYIPKFSAANALTNSQIYDTGTRVGVGKTDPVSRFDVNGKVSADSGLVRNSVTIGDVSGTTDGFNYALIVKRSLPAATIGYFQNTDTTGFSGIRFFNSEGVRLGSFGSGNKGASSYKNQLYMLAQGASTPFILGTNTTERMRITPAGDVGIGTTTPGYKFAVVGTGNFTGDLTLGANAIIATAPTIGSHATNKTYVDAGLLSKLDSSGVRGSTGYVPVFTGTRVIRNSTIYENNGNIGFGTTATGGHKLRIRNNFTDSFSYGVRVDGEVQSSVTSGINMFRTDFSTQAATFNTGTLIHYYAVQGVLGAGSSVTNQFGFRADGGMTGAANNYAFFSTLPESGNANWNLYLPGTAPNYLAGPVGIGGTGFVGVNFRVSRHISGASTSIASWVNGQVQSTGSVTTAYYNRTDASIASGAALTTLIHYGATQGTFSGTTGIQMGFSVASSLTDATNNYGFHSNIPASAGRWNFYAAGSANNFFAGNVGIGISSPTHKLHVDYSDTTTYSPTSQTQGIGLLINNTNNATNNKFAMVKFQIGTSGIGIGYFGIIKPLAGNTSTAFVWTLRGSAGPVDEYMRLTTTGLGIGTLAPAYKLDVNGTGHFVSNVTFDANALIATAPTSGSHAANKTYVDTKQAGDGDLTAIAALTGTGFPKRTGTDTWSLGALSISDVTSLQSSLDTKLDSSGIRGASGYIPKFTATRTIRNSQVFDDGTNIGIGTTTPSAKLQVNGSGSFQSNVSVLGTVTAFKFAGSGPVPSISSGAGAGTLPAVSITGSSTAFHVDVVVGSSPTAGGDVFTITFPTYTSTPHVTFSPQNDAEYYNADITANTRDDSVFITGKSATEFTLKLKTNRSMINSNTYSFDFHIIK